jgi:hypothetical protein
MNPPVGMSVVRDLSRVRAVVSPESCRCGLGLRLLLNPGVFCAADCNSFQVSAVSGDAQTQHSFAQCRGRVRAAGGLPHIWLPGLSFLLIDVSENNQSLGDARAFLAPPLLLDR